MVSGIRRKSWIAPLIVWATGILAFWLAIIWVWVFRPALVFDGFKVRDGSADSAWQTIRLNEMWSFGPTTLWWEHIYPPLYDGIRFLLMQPETLAGSRPDPLAVDLRLYIVHSVLFGLTSMVVYLWVRDLIHNGWWALAGSLLWIVAPGSFAFFIELNQTGLAIAAMAVALYFLYRFCRTRQAGYATGFLVAILVASLTRNVVQIHVLAVLIVAAVAFWWISSNRRGRTLVVNLVLVALIAFWPARAFILYATFDVSTHTGYNRAGALWINPLDVPDVPEYVLQKYEEYVQAKQSLEDPTFLATLSPAEVQENRANLVIQEQQWNQIQEQYPGVDIPSAGVYPDRLLANATKLSSNWNTQQTVRDNYRLSRATNDYILNQPLAAMSSALKSLTITVPTMFRSIYAQWSNGFNSSFPGMQALDWVFSGWRFALVILLSAGIIIGHFGVRLSARLLVRYGWFAVFWVLAAIPVFLSNRYWPTDVSEPVHSEADRLRALIDIPVYVTITFAAFLVFRKARTRWSMRGRDPADTHQVAAPLAAAATD